MTEILILMTLWLTVCALCAAAGFFIGFYFGKQGKKPEPAKLPEPDEKTKRAAEQSRREYENMLTYNGSEQQE